MPPLLAAVALFCGLSLGSAQAGETYGSWSVALGDNSEFIYAATMNDSGALLGQFCYPDSGKCLWMLGMKTTCETGSEYPVLANTDTGAIQLKITCSGPLSNGFYLYAFTEFDAVDAAVAGGTRIGFAVPLQTDQFRVVRFLLSGAAAAIARMHEGARRLGSGRNGTRDQVL